VEEAAVRVSVVLGAAVVVWTAPVVAVCGPVLVCAAPVVACNTPVVVCGVPVVVLWGAVVVPCTPEPTSDYSWHVEAFCTCSLDTCSSRACCLGTCSSNSSCLDTCSSHSSCLSCGCCHASDRKEATIRRVQADFIQWKCQSVINGFLSLEISNKKGTSCNTPNPFLCRIFNLDTWILWNDKSTTSNEQMSVLTKFISLERWVSSWKIRQHRIIAWWISVRRIVVEEHVRSRVSKASVDPLVCTFNGWHDEGTTSVSFRFQWKLEAKI
jgi:hypothetical protein